jgi:hypothetical protein
VALATFLQLLRSQSLQEQRAQRLYRAQVQQVAGRMGEIVDQWVALRQIEPDHARLANASAVYRWELMRMAKDMEQVDTPRSLASIQRDVQNAVTSAARACQLLANGYRSHKSEAVCDGQALLLETAQEIQQLLSQLQIR